MKRIVLVVLLLCGVLAGSAFFGRTPAQVPDGSSQCDAYDDWVRTYQEFHPIIGCWETEFRREAKPCEPYWQVIVNCPNDSHSECLLRPCE